MNEFKQKRPERVREIYERLGIVEEPSTDNTRKVYPKYKVPTPKTYVFRIKCLSLKRNLYITSDAYSKEQALKFVKNHIAMGIGEYKESTLKYITYTAAIVPSCLCNAYLFEELPSKLAKGVRRREKLNKV